MFQTAWPWDFSMAAYETSKRQECMHSGLWEPNIRISSMPASLPIESSFFSFLYILMLLKLKLSPVELKVDIKPGSAGVSI